MLKVKNKRTIRRLATSSLRQYKLRNLFTVITIVLSVGLIAGLAFLSAAIEETERKELAARQHVIYHEVTEQTAENLLNQPRVSAAKEFKSGQSFEKEDYILVPYYVEPSDSPMMKLNIVQGQYPQQRNEVLVYDKLLAKMGLAPTVGQSLSITYLDGTTEEYRVSGILEAPVTDVFSVYFSRAYAEAGSQLKDVPFDLAVQIEGAAQMGAEEFLSVIREIGADAGVERKNINENNAFVDSLSYNTREIMLIALIAAVVLLVSVLVIYSIFYISISERTRQFGQLKTIGMTQKQVKRMVRMEGAVLSAIGSAAGILIGAVFALSLKPQGFHPGVFAAYAAAIFVADYVTVQLSIAKPAKLAARVSPIEATRMSGYEGKSRQKQTQKLQRSLSPWSLSIIAARGNRKKSVMTMLSLCLAGIVFMGCTTFLASLNEEKYARQGFFSFGDFYVSLSSNASQVNEHGQAGLQKDNPLSQQMIADLREIKEVRAVTALQNLHVTYTYQGVPEQDGAAPFAKGDTELLRRYVKEGRVDYEEMVQNKEVVIVHNEAAKEIFGWEFKLGDTFTLKWYNGEEYIEDTFAVGAILQDAGKLYRDEDMFRLSYNTGWFMLPDELLRQMMIPGFNLNSRLVIACYDYARDGKAAEEKIAQVMGENPIVKVSSFRDQLEHSKEQYALFRFTFLGTALFVIAFSVINLLNTLISNAMARKREFACLSAIGASQKQIRTMIFGEGLYFAAANILVTAILGTLAGYAVIAFSNWNGADYLVYRFPIVDLAAYCLFVLAGTAALAAVIAKVIGKKTLVERLREVE